LAVRRVEGVDEAEFSYERAEGSVRYDTTVTNIQEITEELEQMTGFVGTVRDQTRP
jgi:copper chaperone CopZ